LFSGNTALNRGASRCFYTGTATTIIEIAIGLFAEGVPFNGGLALVVVAGVLTACPNKEHNG
jgi:hypothetical protein